MDGAAGRQYPVALVPIPDFQTLMLPVLRLLADGADRTAGSAIEALSDEFELTSEEREQLVGSQRISLMASRVHWAMTYLVQAGLTDRPRRGVWRITDEGTPRALDRSRADRHHAARAVRGLPKLHQQERGRARG